jgi:ADP-heptose:LPS heptosyltransferase
LPKGDIHCTDMRAPIRKAVTFRAPSIGDALMAKYLFDNIHAAYPQARCCLVVSKHALMLRDLLAAYPWIEVVEASRHDVPGVWRLLRDFWKSDLVVTPYTAGVIPLPTKLIARLLARRGGLIGFDDKSFSAGFFYDTVLPRWTRNDAPRLFEQKTLEAAGVPVSREWMSYEHLPQSGLLERLGLVEKGYIVVHLFAGSEARGLSPASRQALADALAQKFPGTRLVFTGTAKDHALIRQLTLPHDVLLPETTVQEMAALITSSLGVVSVGTGPSHMASIMRRPTVVLCNCAGLIWCGTQQHGDAPVQVFSRADKCPEGHNSAGYAHCMDAIDMKEAADAAAALFAR